MEGHSSDIDDPVPGSKERACWSKSRQWSSKDAKPSKERRLRLMMFCAVPVAIPTWVPQVLRSHSGACYACATRRCHRFDRLSGVFRTYRSDSGGSALHARAHRRPPLFLARGRRAFVGWSGTLGAFLSVHGLPATLAP